MVTSLSTSVRVAILAAAVWKCKDTLRDVLFPFGLPVHIPRSERVSLTAEVDPANRSLAAYGRLSKIYERQDVGDGSRSRLLQGPETILFDPTDGTMYALTDEAKLVSLTDLRPATADDVVVGDAGVTILTAKTTEVVHLGVGRPLGGKFDRHGNLYVADTLLGLLRVQRQQPPDGSKKKNGNTTNDAAFARNAPVEIVASRVRLVDGTWSPITYANDVAIGPRTGHVYFTDSTTVVPDRVGTRTWDTMYGSKLDLMRGRRTGRLLRYDPATGVVDVLVATGLWFANGVAVLDEEETAVLLSETFASRTVRYDLTDGTLSVVADELPGYPDGADCAFRRSGAGSSITSRCYAPMPSKSVTLVNLMNRLPDYVDLPFRALLMMLPRTMAPKVAKYGGVVEIEVTNHVDHGSTYKTRILQDPMGDNIAMLTGVTEHNGKLYLGSLTNDYVGVFDLDN